MLYFDSVAEFLAMGGHGFYVWLSYIIALLALLAQFIKAKQAVNYSVKRLTDFYRRLAAREADQHASSSSISSKVEEQ